MKHYIRNVVWKFSDCSLTYPDIPNDKIYIRNPEDLFTHFQSLFSNHVRERFIVFWLNAANRITGFEVVSEGTLNSSLVHPREVYRGAIVATAAAIIIAHNHPSGNKEPSREDIEITRQITQSGKVIGIPCHDHIIFAEDSYTSFAERGLL
jgi:DNA repair protein RadC